jgi:DNA-binding CsgD family transcriptional regulator/tetratricopeptide (TPR) repeat protein
VGGVQAEVSEGRIEVVGRESEFAVLGEFLTSDSPAGALVLTGGPGIGKTTLWEAGIAVARERGWRVLSARPSSAEAQLSFGALIDLCHDLDAGALAGLPAPQRVALEVALLRAEPARLAPEPQAIGLGWLNALRALAARERVLVAVDDVQWLDPPSADVLAFAARRLQGEAAAFLFARRPGRRSALERALERGALERVAVGPLTLGATRRVLSERLGLSVSRPLLRRIVDATQGNPLFALEVGRALAERGPLEIGEDIPLPGAVEDMLGTRVARLPGSLRRLLLAVALSADLHTSELEAIAQPGELDDAIDAGLLLAEGDRVRAAHPLLAAAAKKRSPRRERRELHLVLAGAVVDEELRALHLALATERPDVELAGTVAAAAASASARGARHEAVLLAEHALRLTPRAHEDRSERLLALAGYLDTAGELQRVADVLTAEVASLPAGAARARGWLLLSTGAGVRDGDDYDRHLALALAECQDVPHVKAQVLAMKAENAAVGGVSRIRQSEAWAREALAASRDAGPDVERIALYALGWVLALTGRPIDQLCERSDAAADGSSHLAAAPERVAGQRLVWRGEVTEARATMTRFLALADERGEPFSYALQRLHLCELELRAGEWDAAARLLDEWAESSEGELLFRPMYERCHALLAAGRGLPGDAERWATTAIARAEVTGSRWDLLEALRARGIAELLSHDPARAAQSLRAVWEYTQREGIDEPGVFPAAPELVEALAELGELDEALSVGGRLRELAEEQEHPWGLATAKRCGAIVALASGGYDEGAAVELASAAADYERLGLRFDHARSLLSLGRAQRRVKKWGAARDSLEAAVAAFDEQGSPGWTEQARSELARVGARRPAASGELTPAELRVAQLAADGLANKEIARALHVTVHTVELHLSHAYAKLAIRSRTQLAGRLAASG